MLAPPAGTVGHGPRGRPKPSYYACGWDVRPAGQAGKFTKWHGGLLAGSSTLLVCRDDGIDWAVLFNRNASQDGKEYGTLIDPLLHKPANEIKDWPEIHLFPRF
jgi:N-acyl-D-amino-acid deacylase